MASFAGTTQKCMACDKTVYLVDKLTADNRVYHKACFRCHHCKGTLKVHFSPADYILGFDLELFGLKFYQFFSFLLWIGSSCSMVFSLDVFVCLILQLGNYNSFEGVLYCRPHFDQLFKRTGSLDKSFEGREISRANFFFYLDKYLELKKFILDKYLQGHQRLWSQRSQTSVR